MDIALICIGDELLKGATVNTNMALIGESLLGIGVVPKIALTLPDRIESIEKALDSALNEADMVICTGGLGPTDDDMTRDAVAQKLGLKMVKDNSLAELISDYWNSLKRGPMPSRLLRQAMKPEGASVMPNSCGTAPGLIVPAGDGKLIFLLPGPPAELAPMLRDHCLPRVKEQLKEPLHSRVFHVLGMGESLVEERIQPLMCDSMSVAYCASPESVRLFLTSRDERLLEEKSAGVQALFKGQLLRKGFNSLAEELPELMREGGQTLAVAESCTGGMIASAIVSVPGSSDVFLGAVVAYSNRIKEAVLGVKAETLESKGAVSAECVAEMLEGVCSKFGASAAMAVSGIAGPSGGTPEKPVGLVFIGVKSNEKVEVKEYRFRGGREQIRRRAASTAMNMLRGLVQAG